MSSRPNVLVPATKRLAPGVAKQPDVGPADPSVDLDRLLRGQEAAQALDPRQRLGHERLAGVAGLDAHAEDEIEWLGNLCRLLRLSLRLER